MKEIKCPYLKGGSCNAFNQECKNIHSCMCKEIREIAEDVESANSIRFYRIKNKINKVL